MKGSSLELIVARYTENLNWLNNIPPSFSICIYDKNPTQPYPNATTLPNIGREAHTYLYHIVINYHTLADYTIFCQGKPFDHAFDFHQSLRQIASNPTEVSDFKWFGHIIDTDTPDGELFRQWSKNEDETGLDLAGFYQKLFETPPPLSYPFVLGAQFGVTRTQIQQRPLAFYENALKLATDFPDAAHCFERVWDKVFNTVGIDPVWLAGRKTVYLKRMKSEE